MEGAVPEISIVMPAYNEAANIDAMIRRCVEIGARLGRPVEIVIANDGSTDSTPDILDRWAREASIVRPLHTERNEGYGAALTRALQASRGDLVATIDSDGQFDIRQLPQLLEQMGPEVDLLTGYRETKQDTMVRVLADRGLNLLVRLLFGLRLRDTNCAFKLIRGERARSLPLESRGFSTPTEIVLRAKGAGWRIAEAPVTHAPRAGGMSSLHPLRTGIRFFLFLIYFRLKLSLVRRRVIREL